MPKDMEPQNEIFKGQLGLKAAELKERRGIGKAAVMGNLDRGWDVIFPGAFKKAIKGFLKAGFISLAHDWKVEIGFPVSAKEEGGSLVCEWEYHETERAEEARKIAMKRIEKGLDVGLSIGFSIAPEGRMWFESGKQLLEFAEKAGYDMSLFDRKAIAAHKSICRGILEVGELYEFGQVTVPMNAAATAMQVKGEQPETKSQPNTVGAILQAKIHQSFTVAADELAVRGYMNVEERIALSSVIGNALRQFAGEIDPAVGERVVESDDVDWVASKATDTPTSLSSETELISLRARALGSQAEFVLATL